MPVKWLRRRTESTTKRRVIFAITVPSAVSIRGASLTTCCVRHRRKKVPARRRNAPESPRNENTPRWVQPGPNRGKLPDSGKPFLIPRQDERAD